MAQMKRIGALIYIEKWCLPTSDIIYHRKHVAFKNNSTWMFSSAATQHCPLLCLPDCVL